MRLQLIASLCLAVCACSPRAKPHDPATLIESDDVAPELSAIPSCSPAGPVAGSVFLSWRGTVEHARSLQLEATVYKEGFERQWFAGAPALEPNLKFAPTSELAKQPNFPRALFQLSIGQVQQTEGRVSVEVKGLGPGGVYYLRLLEADGARFRSTRPLRVVGSTCPTERR